MNQSGHMNQNPTEPKFWLVLIHTADGRPLIHIGAKQFFHGSMDYRPFRSFHSRFAVQGKIKTCFKADPVIRIVRLSVLELFDWMLSRVGCAGRTKVAIIRIFTDQWIPGCVVYWSSARLQGVL